MFSILIAKFFRRIMMLQSKKFLRMTSLVILCLPLALTAKVYGETNSDICHLQTSSGMSINLSNICAGSLSRKVMPVTTNLNSPFVKKEGGIYWVELGAPTAFQLPTGQIIYPDGTVREPNTAIYRPIVKNGVLVGSQYFRPDGSPMRSGESLKLPNGSSITQVAY
jgi:hypothetical protein